MKTSQIKLKTSLKPYPEYKDSGIDWIGEIPKDWDLLPWRSGLIERKEKNKKLVTDNILSVTKDRGVIRYADKGDIGNKSSDRPENYKIVYPNDIVINSMNLVIGSVGIARELGVTSSVYLIYRANKERIYIDYIHYLIRTVAFQKYIAKFGKGIMELRESIKADDLKKQLIAIPSIEEQKKIAKYLDEKTELIDQIVEKKKKLIELLKEKRTAIINQAVTKGLDPNAELVDSGIDWIGEIPKDWKVDRMSHYFTANDGGVWGEDDPLEEGRIVLRSTEINQDGSWELEGAITRKLTEQEFLKGKLYEDDLLLTKSSGSAIHLGKTAIVSKEIEERGCAYSNFMQRIRLNKKILPKFFFFLINNKIGRDQINYWGSTTSGLVNLNGSLVGRFIFPIPSVDKQREIISNLDEKTNAIDSLIEEVRKSVEMLKEFKSSLISNVVTGKVKV